MADSSNEVATALSSRLAALSSSASASSSSPATIAAGAPLVAGAGGRSTVGKCHLVVGRFALLVQGCLGCIAFSSLLLKRHLEYPKRSWKVWALDILKQMISAVAAHATGEDSACRREGKSS